MTTQTTRSRPTRAAGLVLTVAAALLAAACSDPAGAAPVDSQGKTVNTSPDQDRVKGTEDAAAAALVPAAIRERGSITVANAGAGGGTPPLVFTADDDKTPIGVEVDLAYLFADTLGLKIEPQTTSWENVFIGLDSKRYDAALSNITVTEERKQKYDFATYRKDDISFEVPKDADWKVEGRKDIAGRTIAVGSGTNQEKILVDWNEANVAEGLEPATIKYFQNQTDYYLALSSQRIDAYFGPNPSVQYHIATGGTTKEIGSFSGAGDSLQGLIAVTTPRGTGLAAAFQKAIDASIANGTYAKVLERWSLDNEALPKSELNPPGLPLTK